MSCSRHSERRPKWFSVLVRPPPDWNTLASCVFVRPRPDSVPWTVRGIPSRYKRPQHRDMGGLSGGCYIISIWKTLGVSTFRTECLSESCSLCGPSAAELRMLAGYPGNSWSFLLLAAAKAATSTRSFFCSSSQYKRDTNGSHLLWDALWKTLSRYWDCTLSRLLSSEKCFFFLLMENHYKQLIEKYNFYFCITHFFSRLVKLSIH